MCWKCNTALFSMPEIYISSSHMITKCYVIPSSVLNYIPDLSVCPTQTSAVPLVSLSAVRLLEMGAVSSAMTLSFLPHPTASLPVWWFLLPSKYIQKLTIYSCHFSSPGSSSDYFSLYSCNSFFIGLHDGDFRAMTAPVQTLLHCGNQWEAV